MTTRSSLAAAPVSIATQDGVTYIDIGPFQFAVDGDDVLVTCPLDLRSQIDRALAHPQVRAALAAATPAPLSHAA